MGQGCWRVWELFVKLTELDSFEIQKELNPIIQKLNINLDKIQMDDIRRIVAAYMKKTLDSERRKSVAFHEEAKGRPNYNHH